MSRRISDRIRDEAILIVSVAASGGVFLEDKHGGGFVPTYSDISDNLRRFDLYPNRGIDHPFQPRGSIGPTKSH